MGEMMKNKVLDLLPFLLIVDFRFSSGYKNRVLLEAKLEKIVGFGMV